MLLKSFLSASVHDGLPVQSERHMNKKSKDDKSDDLRSEYDLRELLKNGVQGKYADRFHEGTNLVLLDSDVVKTFPNDEAVNRALRLVIKLTKLTMPENKSVHKGAYSPT